MPELPEVETVRAYLSQSIDGLEITDYQQNVAKLRFIISSDIKENIVGHKILNIGRRAKYILVNLDNNKVIILHLGMSGKIIVTNHSYKQVKHDHVIITFNNDKKIIFNDPRRFGMIYCENNKDLDGLKFIKHLAPEPLSDEFDDEYLSNIIRKLKSPIKTIVMNNKYVVGVGNIYASESLFKARIHPGKVGCKIQKLECTRLVNAIKEVLNAAIKAGGTTLKDYRQANDKPGYFQQELCVYNRENKECLACNEVVIKAFVQSGRKTYYCPKCQIN